MSTAFIAPSISWRGSGDLAFLEAPPSGTTRTFVLDNIKRGQPQFVAVSANSEAVDAPAGSGASRRFATRV